MSLGKTHDLVVESDRLAGVPHKALATVLADAPSESVANGRIVGGRRGNQRFIEPAALQPRDPVDEIVNRRVNAAVAEDGAGQALVGATPSFISATVSVGPVRDSRDSFFKRDGRVHPRRFENILAKKI